MSNENLKTAKNTDASGRRLSRRQVLQSGAGSVALVSLAGCSDGDGGDSSGGGDGGSTTTAQSIESVNFRLSNSVPESAIFSQYGRRFIENCEEASGGQISGELFPNSQLGTTVEQANSVKTGTIDMAIVPMSPIFRDFSVMAYPYVYEDYDHLLRAYNPDESPVMQDLLERMGSEANVRFLAPSILGTRQTSLNTTEACTPTDMEGLDIRSPQLELFTETVRGLGGNPANIDVTELVSSLSSGSVQGQENPTPTIRAYGLDEVQDYVIETEHIRHALPHYCNLDWWNGLSDSAKDIVQQAANEAAKWNAESISSIEDEADTYLQENGMTFVGKDGCLDLEAFRTSVRDRVDNAFPEWAEIAADLEAI
jgi:TRAP-type C4-dicarboxylate transport system substrate-binding protein